MDKPLEFLSDCLPAAIDSNQLVLLLPVRTSRTSTLNFLIKIAKFSFQYQFHSFRYPSMAHIIISNLPFSPLFACQNRPSCPTIHKHTLPAIGGKQGRVGFIAKARSGSSESSTSLNTVSSDQSIWDKPEDLVALLGVGFAGVAVFWASISVTNAIDKLPVLPGVLELIGILFSTWFVYRYLLFKPDRKELAEIIKKSLADIIGQ